MGQVVLLATTAFVAAWVAILDSTPAPGVLRLPNSDSPPVTTRGTPPAPMRADADGEAWLDLSESDPELEWKLGGAAGHHGDRLEPGLHAMTACWPSRPGDVAATAEVEAAGAGPFAPSMRWTHAVCGVVDEWEWASLLPRHRAAVWLRHARRADGLWSERAPGAPAATAALVTEEDLETTGLVLVGAGFPECHVHRADEMQVALHSALGTDGWFRASAGRVRARTQAILVTALAGWPEGAVRIIDGGEPRQMAVRGARALLNGPPAPFAPDVDVETAAWTALAFGAALRIDQRAIDPPTAAAARDWVMRRVRAALTDEDDAAARHLAMLTFAARLLAIDHDGDADLLAGGRRVTAAPLVTASGFEPVECLFASLVASHRDTPGAAPWKTASGDALVALQHFSRRIEENGRWDGRTTRGGTRVGEVTTTAFAAGALTMLRGATRFRLLDLATSRR
jgi:hypothetical protein